MEIKKSKEYEKFSYYRFNREIDKSKVSKIADSIVKYDVLRPILVDHTLFIIDGQHTFEACRMVDCEVPYIIMNIDTEKIPPLMATLNSTSKTWALSNYLDMWSSLNRKSYIYLKSKMSEYNLKVTEIIMVMGRNKDFNQKFREGTMIIDSKKQAFIQTRLSHISDIRSILHNDKKLVDSKPLTIAITKVIIHLEYDHKKMMNKLSENSGRIRPSKNRADYIQQLQSLYNYKCRKIIEFQKG